MITSKNVFFFDNQNVKLGGYFLENSMAPLETEWNPYVSNC